MNINGIDGEDIVRLRREKPGLLERTLTIEPLDLEWDWIPMESKVTLTDEEIISCWRNGQYRLKEDLRTKPTIEGLSELLSRATKRISELQLIIFTNSQRSPIQKDLRINGLSEKELHELIKDDPDELEQLTPARPESWHPVFIGARPVEHIKQDWLDGKYRRKK